MGDKFARFQAQFDKIPEEVEETTEAATTEAEPQEENQVLSGEKPSDANKPESQDNPTTPDNTLLQKVATLEAEKADLQAKLAEAQEAVRVLSSQPKLGDEFITGLVSRYNKGEDLTPYIYAKSIDYSKMTDKQILFENLRRENPRLSKEHLDVVFEIELEKYKQAEPSKYDEREVERGAILLQVHADKIREQLAKEQQQYLAPPVSDRPSVDPDTQAIVEGWVNTITTSDTTKSIKEKKSVGVKLKGKDYFLPVAQVETIVNDIQDLSSAPFWQRHLDKDGNPDLNKLYDTYNYVYNKDTVIAKIFELGEEYGKSQILEGDTGKNSTLSGNHGAQTQNLGAKQTDDQMLIESLRGLKKQY